MKLIPTFLAALSVAALHAETLTVPATIPTGLEKDVTAELNEFLKSAPDGSTVEFPGKAVYRIEGTLLLKGRKGLTIDGKGATIRATDPLPDYGKKDNYSGWRKVRTRSQWLVEDCEDMVFKNLRVIGAYENGGRQGVYDYNREAQHAFDILAVKGILIENIHASDVWGDGVYISKNSREVTVRKCRIERTGRQGMAIGSAFHILIEDCDILDSRRGLLDIEPYGKEWACGDIRVIGNRFGDSRLLALPMGGSGATAAVLVANNTFTGPSGTPLVMHRTKEVGVKRGPFFFVGNTARVGGSPAPGLRFGEVDGVLIAGNVLTFNPKRKMAVIGTKTGSTGVIGNSFPGADRISDEEEKAHLIESGNTMEEGKASPAEVREIEGGYAIRVKLADESEVVGLMRAEATDGPALAAFGLKTTKQWAWQLRKGTEVAEAAEGE